MSYEVISIKVNPAIKKQAQNAAEEVGLSLSAVIKGFLKQFIRTKTVTFTAQEAEEPSEYLKQAIRQAEKDWKTGNTSPAFDNAEDAIAWLHKSKV